MPQRRAFLKKAKEARFPSREARLFLCLKGFFLQA